MIEQAGRFIGMMAADIANLFRGRQLVPCTVPWDELPGEVYNSGEEFLASLEPECCDSCEHGCWGE